MFATSHRWCSTVKRFRIESAMVPDWPQQQESKYVCSKTHLLHCSCWVCYFCGNFFPSWPWKHYTEVFFLSCSCIGRMTKLLQITASNWFFFSFAAAKLCIYLPEMFWYFVKFNLTVCLCNYKHTFKFQWHVGPTFKNKWDCLWLF